MNPRSFISLSALCPVLLVASQLHAAVVPDTLLTTFQQPAGFQSGGQQGALVDMDGTTVLGRTRPITPTAHKTVTIVHSPPSNDRAFITKVVRYHRRENSHGR